MSLRKKEDKAYNGAYGDVWRNVSGGTPFGTYDVFNSQRNPSDPELIRAEEETVAACVRTIVHKMGSIEPLLFTTATEPSLERSLKSVGNVTRKWVIKNGRISRLIRKAKLHLDEVVDHDLLDLLHNPNPYHTYEDLVKIVGRYVEVTGNGFVWIQFDEVTKVPVALYPLPVTQVALKKDDKNHTVGYEFRTPDGDPVHMSLDEVIHFTSDVDLTDIYGRGISPLRMVWQKVQLGRKDASYWEALFTNMGRPDIVISAKTDDVTLTPSQKERIIRDFVQAFRGGANGLPLFLDGPFDFKPLVYAPKDMASFELIRAIKQAISNQYGVPLTIFETPDSTYSSASAGYIFFIENTITPRVNSFFSKLNKHLTPYFGTNLFLCPEDYSPRDRAFELNEDTALFDRQALTVNEFREKRGYAPLPDGDKVGNPAGTPYGGINMALQTPIVEKAEATTEEVEPVTEQPDDDQGLAAALKDIFKRQKEATLEAVQTLEFKSLHGKSVLTKADWQHPHYVWKAIPEDTIIDLREWDQEMKDILSPIIEAIAATSGEQTANKLKLTPTIGRVVQPKIRESAQALTLEFCKTTNETTSMILSDALHKLREEIGEGVHQGEVRQAIAKRVSDVFEHSEGIRAERIAATESLRARHDASLTVARESGIVKGKRVLPASNACKLCQGVARKGFVPLDQPLADFGNGPYDKPQTTPLHPFCRCGTVYEVE